MKKKTRRRNLKRWQFRRTPMKLMRGWSHAKMERAGCVKHTFRASFVQFGGVAISGPTIMSITSREIWNPMDGPGPDDVEYPRDVNR